VAILLATLLATFENDDSSRTYDPKVGRWLSHDPIGFVAGDSDLYRYVRNDPTGSSDPSGWVECVDSIGLTVTDKHYLRGLLDGHAFRVDIGLSYPGGKPSNRGESGTILNGTGCL
jgi:uncharacterized protein RhaS with RHS repeats